MLHSPAVIRNIRQYCSTVDILLYGTIIHNRRGFVNEILLIILRNFVGNYEHKLCVLRLAILYIVKGLRYPGRYGSPFGVERITFCVF